jgi:hypothetical protein
MRTCYACDGTGVFEWIDVKFTTLEMALEAGDEELEGVRLDIPRRGVCPICKGKKEVK